MRKLMLFAALLLAACAPPDDTKVIVGTVMQTLTSADGKVVATLTQDGDLYRVYLQGQAPGQELWKMFDSSQSQPVKMEWKDAGTIMLHGICGGVMHYPKGTGNDYPDPDAQHGIGVGFRCD